MPDAPESNLASKKNYHYFLTQLEPLMGAVELGKKEESIPLTNSLHFRVALGQHVIVIPKLDEPYEIVAAEFVDDWENWEEVR